MFKLRLLLTLSSILGPILLLTLSMLLILNIIWGHWNEETATIITLLNLTHAVRLSPEPGVKGPNGSLKKTSFQKIAKFECIRN